MTMQISAALLQGALDGGIDFRTLFNAGRVRLFKSNTTPDCNTVIGDLTEANFDGYAAKTPVFAAATIAACVAEINAGTQTWTQTGAVTPNTVYGYYLTDAGGTVLYASERNPAGGVSMAAAGNTFAISPLRMRSQAI